MCNDNFNLRLAPANEVLKLDLISRFPSQKEYIEDLYNVLTLNLSAQANLLVMFTLLKIQADNNEKGIFAKFGNVLYAPLSIVAKTGEHEWSRFRTKQVEELHTSFLSFMMAQENRIGLNKTLAKYNLSFATAHCCGIIFGDKKSVRALMNSDLIKVRNRMRSYAESMAMPVHVEEVQNIPTINSDLGKTEKELYEAYEAFFETATPQSRRDFVDEAKVAEWEQILKAKTDIKYTKYKELEQMNRFKRLRASVNG